MTAETQLIDPAKLEAAQAGVRGVLKELDAMLLGRHELHEMVLVGILSGGHILLEGLPGVGKTALISALGELLRLEFRRVQFTPDLMPGDILGSHILQTTDSGSREMRFQPGPVFTNILLADEINRASPKTQSALLEAMQERSVTLMGNTRALPKPFFVLASQNPIELEGTYPLPEAQLDRFLLKLHVAAADVDTMEAIITSRRHGIMPKPSRVFSRDAFDTAVAAVGEIFLPRPVANYIARLVAATHPGALAATDDVKNFVTFGASPRAAIAMAEASRALALLRGRATVGFDTVKAVAPAVLNHRILLNYRARFNQLDTYAVIAGLLDSLDETGLELPRDMAVERMEV